MGIFLDAHALEQLNGEHKPLLDTIHGLRNHGVGQLIDLPRIIVVGDQSSGKSSVLESILRVRFSFEDELCTRFATELILRTGPELNFNVQIQPAESANEDAQSFHETCSNNDDLRDIIEGAKRAMLQDGAGFSEDILRIELFGPDLPNLVIADLPGFLPSEDNNQSAGDRTVVDRLIESYMAQKTSIILAVVSAQTQLVLQKVLWKVKLHDKENVRPLGIITKPDTVKSSRDEKTFVSLAQNLDKSHSLSLGWHVLRNRAEDEFDTMDDERDDQEEKFFQSGSWSSVPQENRGIDAFRRRLSDILYNHIKTKLPRLVEDIENEISERQARLTLLGEPRSSPREIRSYLGRIASQFQIVSLQAVDGNYLHEFFGGLYPDTAGLTQKEGRIRKLRTLVGVFNRAFAYVLATKGSTHIILPKGVSAENDTSRQQESRYPGVSMRNDTKPAPSGRDASVQTSGGQLPVAPSAVGTINTLPVSSGLFGGSAQTGRCLFGSKAPYQPASGSFFGSSTPTQPASGGLFGGSAPTGRPLFGGQPSTQSASSGFMGRGNTNVPDSTKDGATFTPYSGPGLSGGSSYPAANRPVASPFNVDPFTPTITNGAKPLTSKY
ncbi:hypothetical protein KJ359_008083 [Pestalotiopsis sp. 9143b]|nr:hypothetical protein KJ359_008083 [Pestalotiopsis sp. 9143b]